MAPFKLTLLLLAAFAVVHAQYEQGPCPESDDVYNPRFNALGTNGSCWRHIPTMKSWVDARIHCHKLGGDLAEIRSDEDNDLFNYLQPNGEWTWHGMSDRISETGRVEEEEGWYYLDGTPATYEKFDNNEQNDAGGLGQNNDRNLNGEDCVHMWRSSGRWNDLPCDAWKPFVCAIPVGPPAREKCRDGTHCHTTAYCDVVEGVETCTCGIGYHGNGTGDQGCSGDGWTVRFNIYLPDWMVQSGDLMAHPRFEGLYTLKYFDIMKDEYASLLTPEGYRTGGAHSKYTTEGWGRQRPGYAPTRRAGLPVNFLQSMQHVVTDLTLIAEGYEMMTVAPNGTGYMLTVNSIFPDQASAEEARDEMEHNLRGNHSQFFGYDAGETVPVVFGVRLVADNFPLEPRVYRWVAESAMSEIQVLATGMTVEGVVFEPACEQSGCWVLDVLFTIGRDNFNTFYLPRAEGDDALSYDYDYAAPHPLFGLSPSETFVASNFPCESISYNPESDDPFHPISPPDEVTVCCMPKLIGLYRPMQKFVDDVATMGVSAESCAAGIVQTVARPWWNAPPLPGPAPYDSAELEIACPGDIAALVGGAPVCYGLNATGPAGRVDHEYAADDARAWLLQAPGAAGDRTGPALEIVFELFDVAADGDRLRVYACGDAACDVATRTLVADATGAYDPFAITVCSGFALITFASDGEHEGPGFMARYYALSECPVADPAEVDKSLRAPGDGSENPDPNQVAAAVRGTVAKPSNSLYGYFSGMNHSYVRFQSVEDPFIGQYRAKVYLDEVELRQKGAMLRGTVGVEYSLDTFLGLANFKPTGTQFIDPFGAQTALHLERTSFFSVSTHGTNDYTFLEYVNLRLVTVYREGAAAPAANDSSVRTGDTPSAASADYVQVTFTLGPQYRPIETGLIPLDSVRAGKGIFFPAASEMAHVCADYTAGAGAGFDGGQRAVFDSRFPWDEADADGAGNQQCGPNARFCVSPTDVPDQFVSFNIPLGVDWLPPAAADLSQNVFVDMVVSAVDVVATGTPNSGDDPQQMKTTLTASIPVVEGGVNIFCDGLVARTDLKDVADADIIVGSASSAEELTRLRILTDVASSQLTQVDPQPIDSDSIEAGLMTLVLKGNASYFGLGGTQRSALQLEDVMTIHIMEPGSARNDAVLALMAAAPDAAASSELYPLNQAFEIDVDRATQRALLNPTSALLALCPFSPPRPTVAEPFPTTCVLRRDVRERAFPLFAGAAMAIELPAATVALDDGSARAGVAGFMQTVLGESEYAAGLGRNFSHVVAEAYGLNGQWLRAFWVNPGYEWTPTQTGGQPLFTVSQKLILVALITLDEGFGRRRRLLAAEGEASPGAGMTGNAFEFSSSPKNIMMQAFDVPATHVATVAFVLGLSAEEACLSNAALKAALKATLTQALAATAAPTQTVEILSVSVDAADVQCRRALSRSRALLSGASAALEAIVVFEAAATPKIDMAALSALEQVQSVEAIDVPEGAIGPLSETPEPEGGGDDDDDFFSSWKFWTIIGTCGGAVVVCCVGGVALLMLQRRAPAAAAGGTMHAELVASSKAQSTDKLEEEVVKLKPKAREVTIDEPPQEDEEQEEEKVVEQQQQEQQPPQGVVEGDNVPPQGDFVPPVEQVPFQGPPPPFPQHPNGFSPAEQQYYDHVSYQQQLYQQQQAHYQQQQFLQQQQAHYQQQQQQMYAQGGGYPLQGQAAYPLQGGASSLERAQPEAPSSNFLVEMLMGIASMFGFGSQNTQPRPPPRRSAPPAPGVAPVQQPQQQQPPPQQNPSFDAPLQYVQLQDGSYVQVEPGPRHMPM